MRVIRVCKQFNWNRRRHKSRCSSFASGPRRLGELIETHSNNRLLRIVAVRGGDRI